MTERHPRCSLEAERPGAGGGVYGPPNPPTAGGTGSPRLGGGGALRRVAPP